jgi:hypothetical protein
MGNSECEWQGKFLVRNCGHALKNLNNIIKTIQLGEAMPKASLKPGISC